MELRGSEVGWEGWRAGAGRDGGRREAGTEGDRVGSMDGGR